MKAKFSFLTLAAAATLLAGCDDHDGIYMVNPTLDDVFRTMYAGATHVEWELKQGYYVVDFRQNGVEAEAWFDSRGTWLMTETDVRYADLPEAVRAAFSESEWAEAHIDDVGHFETPAGEYYLVEVESGNREAHVKIDVNGNIL